VFLPGQKNPLVLRQNTGELFLLARLRDEAHRFAITYHRKLRRERNFHSVLEQIPGVGEKRKRALLSHFGSLKRIRAASAEEIGEVEGFNLQLAERIQRFLAVEARAALEAEALEAAQGAADQGEGPEPDGPAIATDREDVAFDAAAAELMAIEEDEVVPEDAEQEPGQSVDTARIAPGPEPVPE
jgi:excinuclease ABC subunit C